MSRDSAALATAVVLALLGAEPARADFMNRWTTLQQGLYLVRAGDCAACHTVDEDAPMAGGYPLETPFGTIYSANLTPDEFTGIGTWSAGTFWRAMNEGIGAGGKKLYPAFPYTHFTVITRDDSDKIFAYLNSLEPVSNRIPEPEFPWPLNIRMTMFGWNMLFFEDRAFEPSPDRSPEWNRGRYLVVGLAHCGMCHSPKNMLGAESGGEAVFSGGMAEGWWAPSLTSDERDGIGHWEQEELVAFLKHGRNKYTIAFGPMADVVEHSTQYLSNSDLNAIATYIMSIPAREEEAAEPVVEDDAVMSRGRLVYDTQCSACHAPEGEGVARQFPKLAGSSLVHSSNPTTIIRIILEGNQAATTPEEPTAHSMPPFDWKLSDDDVAAVATYIRNAFGNVASVVTAETVAGIRGTGDDETRLTIADR